MQENGGPTGKAGSRADHIRDAIRCAVVEQRIAPGTRLSEDAIGSLFGASRTIVRAALQSLAHDRIVTLARHRGASVAAPTVADARDLFDARRAIEEVIVRRAAPRMTPSTERLLSDLIEAGRRALAAGDRGLAIRHSGEFHLAVGIAAAQPVLHGFLGELVSRSSLVIALYGRSHAADCGGCDHAAILGALARGDAAAAASLMSDHLTAIEADLDLSDRRRAPVDLRDALRAGAAPA